jgi:hypothetical protein
VSKPVSAPAKLGGVEHSSARAAVRKWVRSRIAARADSVPRRRGRHRRRPSPARQIELTSIIEQAIDQTAAAVFEDDPVLRQRFLDALLDADPREWPLVDGTDLEDLVDNTRYWLAERDFLAEPGPGSPDLVLHACLASLCEHVIIEFGTRAERDSAKHSDQRQRWVRFWDREIGAARLRGRMRLMRPLVAVGAMALIATLPVTLADLLPRPARSSEDDPSNDGSTGEKTSGGTGAETGADQSAGGSPPESTAPVEPTGPTALEAARTACTPTAESVKIDDGGFTLIIERAVAEEDPSIGWDELECLFEELQIPGSVVSRVKSTSALSGIQEGEWDDFTAFWTFHVEEGLHMTISQLVD